MPQQRLRRGRHAMPGQIGRRTDDQHARAPQLARHQARAFQRPRAHGHVGALLEDVDDLIGQHDIQRHLGMLREELGHQRQQEVMPERHVGVDSQAPTRRRVFARTPLGFLQIGQDTHPALVERASLGRQLQLTGGAVQQAGSQALFEPGDQLADCRGRHAATSSGGGKAPRLDDPGKHLQFAGTVDFKPGHGALPDDFAS